MAHANHAIISEPRRNRLEVLNSTELARAWKPPAPLDYHGNIRSLNVTHSYSPHQGAEDETGKDFRYTVPDDLVRAAQLVSENWTPSEQGDGLASAASEVQHNHGQEHNGSNQTPASLQYGSRTAVANSNPDIVDLSRRDGRTHELLQRRNANEWWMATMAQRGSSPFAPSGYKVWRNVKDFGAKGLSHTFPTQLIDSQGVWLTSSSRRWCRGRYRCYQLSNLERRQMWRRRLHGKHHLPSHCVFPPGHLQSQPDYHSILQHRAPR